MNTTCTTLTARLAAAAASATITFVLFSGVVSLGQPAQSQPQLAAVSAPAPR
jgi:hypothetical protein